MTAWLDKNWLTVIVVVLLLGSMLYGHYLGFMRTALTMAVAVLTFVLTRVAFPYVVTFCANVFNVHDVEPFKLNICVYLGLFVAVWLLIRLLIRVTDLVARIPIIHGLNQIAGAVLGLALALVFIWLAALLVRAFAGTAVGGQLQAQIEESRFLSFLYRNNVLVTLLKGVIYYLI